MVLTGGTKFAFGSDGPRKGYAIFVAGATAAKELTDTLDLEIELPNNASGTSKFGGFGMSYHHLLFKKSVTAPDGAFYAADQMQGNLTVEGPLVGFTKVFRPNGRGRIWFKSADTAFSVSNPTHQLREGSLMVDSQAAAGGTEVSFEPGQQSYETPGKFFVNAQEDTLFTGSLSFRGPNYRDGAGQLYNEVAGTTATFTGNLRALTGKSTYANCDGLGTGATFGGAGNGVFSGDIESPQVFVYKTGTGTWTLAGQSSATGMVKVSAGTLLMNGDYSTAERSQVVANARLGGTGRLGDVTFAANSILGVTNVMGGTALQVGAVTLPGSVKVDLLDTVVPAAGTYTVLSFDSRNGSGAFVLGTGWPEGTTLTLGATTLSLTIPARVLTWTGATSTAWDFTSENWMAGLFADGMAAVFGDAGQQTSVVLTQEVRPASITVSGTKDYTFSGSTIAGPCALEKSGTGTLVLANDNTYKGDTCVNAGALRVEGVLDGSTVRIGSNAAFTNTVSGRITGPGAVVSSGTVELNGTNDFTGGLTLKGLSVVTNPRALGNGDLIVGGTKKIQIRGGVEGVGRGHTLYAEYTDGSEGHPIEVPSGTFRWLGNVVSRNQRLFVRCVSSASIVFGEPGCDTTVVTEGVSGSGICGFYVRDNGPVHFHSRVDLGNSGFWQTDYNAIYFHAPGNRWNELRINVGVIYCRTNNTLAYAPVQMGQTYQNYSFNPVLDLSGFDQTISGLVMAQSASTSSQTVKSDTPATLTISNDVTTTTLRMQCKIKGAITLRKDGTGTWNFGAQNQTTGNVEIVSGTLKLTASDTLPAGDDSLLTIEPGAKLVLDEGVAASIAYATVGGHPLKAGVYCGEGGTGTRLDSYIGAGAGSLTVTRGVNGMVIIFR